MLKLLFANYKLLFQKVLINQAIASQDKSRMFLIDIFKVPVKVCGSHQYHNHKKMQSDEVIQSAIFCNINFKIKISMKRKSTAIWQGNGMEGKGKLTIPAECLKDHSIFHLFTIKNEDGLAGTNPEELISCRP